MLAMRLAAALLATTATVVAGCAHTVTGAAEWSPDQSVGPLRADDPARVLVTAAQVRDLAGAWMQIDADRTRPVQGSSAVPACSALDSVGMAAFVGETWSGIRVLLFTDGDRHDRVVAEAVAVYPDAAAAAAAFGTGTKDVHACDGQLAFSTGGDAAWQFSVRERTTDGVRWTKRQLGIPLTWICHGEARVRNNAVLQAMACQGDDGGRVMVTTLTDRMSAGVWELSGR